MTQFDPAEWKYQQERWERERPLLDALVEARGEAMDAAISMVNRWTKSDWQYRTEIETAYPALHHELDALYHALIALDKAQKAMQAARTEV
jgi:hypothetical protein